MSKSAWLIIIILLLLFLILLIISYQPGVDVAAFRSRGTIKSDFKVFFDEAQTEEVTVIDWGVLDLGTNMTVTVYLEDAVADVEVTTANWSSAEAQKFLTLTSLCEGGQLGLTLHVSPEIRDVETFSFDIIITKR